MTHRSLRFLLPAFALVLALPVAALPAAAQTAAAQTVDTYTIDAVHSNVGFRIRHLVSKTAGRFGGIQGKVLVDTKDITKSSVTVSIDTATISTNSEARDNHLKSEDFFDVAKFPAITFQSTTVAQVAEGKLNVTGTFTMHGVAKTITIPVSNLGTTAGMKPGSVVAGFEGAITLKRSDYGMSKMIGPLGDEVEVTLNIEAGK